MSEQVFANASIAESRRLQALLAEELCAFPFLCCRVCYLFPNVHGDDDGGGWVGVRGKYCRIAIQAEKGMRWKGTKIQEMDGSLSLPIFDFEINGTDQLALKPLQQIFRY